MALEASRGEAAQDGRSAAADDSRRAWDDVAAIYAERSLKSTPACAALLIEEAHRLLPFSSPGAHVLDVGCGPGAVAVALSSRFPDVGVLASDFSPRMLAILAGRRLPNVQVTEADGMDLSPVLARHPQRFSHVLSAFMNQFTPDPVQPVREMMAATRPGGVVGLASWGTYDKERIFTAAARSIDPSWDSPGMWSTMDFPEDAAGLQQLFKSLGLEQVRSSRKTIVFELDSAESCVDLFFGSNNPAFNKVIHTFRSLHGDDGVQEARRRMPEIMERDGWDLAKIQCEAFITVGCKPAP
ncbi:hypothetical protein CDD83_8977 [Cordyceps sp. RAO-2017]|nr:hypothetical protein CDD83_8977 [Cordyceps sp. RAO-2017]